MRPKVLLVDDDPAVRDSLRRVLLSEDYAVELASEGAEALEVLARGQIDLVLLDLALPLVDGWEVLERLKSRRSSIPVIVITAQPHQQAAALAAGASGLMEKPLDLPTLLAMMANLVGERHKQPVC